MPGQYPLVPIPQGPDPMQSLSSLMGMVGQMQAMKQAKLEGPGRIANQEALNAERTSLTNERNQQTTDRKQLVADQQTINTLLQEGGDEATITERMRAGGHANLIPQVQKSFDDARTRKAAYDKTVADTNKANVDAEETQQKIREKHADYLGGIAASVRDHGYHPDAFFQGVALAHNDGMIDPQAAGRAIAMGIQTPDQIKPFVDAGIAASPEQRKLEADRNKPATTLQGAILAARDKGDTAGVNALIKLQGQFRAAGRDDSGGGAPVTPDMIKAVTDFPALWRDLTPTTRDKMIGQLSRAGFDFRAASAGLTDAQKAGVERWRATALERVETDLAAHKPLGENDQTAMTPAEAARRRAAIEASYRAQMGTAAPAAPAPPPAAPAAPVVPTAAAPPARAGGPGPATAPVTPAAGGQTQLVKMPDGSTMEFTQAQYAEFVKQAAAAGYSITNSKAP